MKLRRLIFSLVFALQLVMPRAALSEGIVTPPSLRGQVDFWLLVFTRYGKNQLIFHHRENPTVIYSVLDFTDMSRNFSGAAFERRKSEEIELETIRIQDTLLKLAEGKAAQSPFEKRIERLFRQVRRLGPLGPDYKEAALVENIRSQTGIKERFQEGLERSRRYLHAIERIFRERGLPVELSRLPLVESSFNYNAYSSVGAAGIWQFMRGTGKRYLRIDNYIDERRDPILSTRAAAEYLAHAKKSLDHWPLAVTSYNHGITGVLRGTRATNSTDLAVLIKRYDGSGWGFASKNFYTEFLAAVEADRGARMYFPDIQFEQPLYFDEVKIPSPIGIKDLAKRAGMSADVLAELNPGFLKPITSGRVPVPAGRVVKVPAGKGAVLVKSFPGSSIYSLTERLQVLKAPPAPKRAKVRASVPQKKVTGKAAPKKAAVKKPAQKTPAKKKAPAKPAAAKKPAAPKPAAKKPAAEKK